MCIIKKTSPEKQLANGSLKYVKYKDEGQCQKLKPKCIRHINNTCVNTISLLICLPLINNVKVSTRNWSSSEKKLFILIHHFLGHC